MDKSFDLLAALADGRAHSGASLATLLHVSRAAVWNRVKRLQALGVDIYAVRGKGYQLARGFEFLNEHAIRHGLTPLAADALRTITVSPVTDSTNQRLLELVPTQGIHGHAWLAEYQTAGRGRRGDRWLAPPGSAVCLSLGWRFDAPPRDLSALSLVVGIAIAQALSSLGARGIGLKWPNDLLVRQRKLAGILIEMRSELGGPCSVVIGVGVNVALGDDVRAKIDQPSTSLADCCERIPARNQVAAALLSALVAQLQTFSAQGFASQLAAWRELDALQGNEVELVLPDRFVRGVARGVDPHGMLQIEHNGRLETFLSGHVRLTQA